MEPLKRIETYSHNSEKYFLQSPSSFSNINERYNYFLERMNSAASALSPLNKPFRVIWKPPPPWWDSEYDEAVKRRKLTINIYEINSNYETFILCNQESAKIKRFVKKNWALYCSKLNINTPSKELCSQAKNDETGPNNFQSEKWWAVVVWTFLGQNCPSTSYCWE